MTSTDIRIISLLIQKHMMLLGATAALSRARAIPGIVVAENGDILSFTGSPVSLYTMLKSSYASFAGEASENISRALEKETAVSFEAHRR